MKNKKELLLSLFIILGLGLIIFGGYKIFFDKNNDENTEMQIEDYDVVIYINKLDGYMIPTSEFEKNEFSQKYDYYDGIKFANNDSIYTIVGEDNKYILFYDKELVLYNVKSREKNVIDVDINKYFSVEKLDDAMWFVNENEKGIPVGLTMSFPEHVWSDDDNYSHKKIGFYYNINDKKVILENKYMVIKPTNNPNYLQLSLSLDFGQVWSYHEIYDIKNNKIIFSLNPKEYNYSELNIYETNGKKQFLGYNFWGQLGVFDEQMNNIRTINFPDCCDVYGHEHYGDHSGVGGYDEKTGNYVLPKDNKISTYNLNGDLIKTTEKYEKIHVVRYDYSIVEKDGYFTIVKNDGTFKHNIGKINDFKIPEDWDNHVITMGYEDNIISFGIDDSEYLINKLTNEIMKVE